jgi:hypothetical protein
MKKLLLCILCLLLLASCGQKQEQPAQTSAAGATGDAVDGEIDEAIFDLPPDETSLDVPDEIVTEAQAPAAKELSCVPLEKDGDVYGFEMRFRRTDKIDAMMASTDNFYYGTLQHGKKKITVPTEEIRVLLDVPTDSFVVTMLVPQGEKLKGNDATVSFYISARSDGASKALFSAQQAVDFS